MIDVPRVRLHQEDVAEAERERNAVADLDDLGTELHQLGDPGCRRLFGAGGTGHCSRQSDHERDGEQEKPRPERSIASLGLIFTSAKTEIE